MRVGGDGTAIRMRWNGSFYLKSINDNQLPAPEWPSVPFWRLMELAYRKTGCLVSDLNHPVIKMLRGQL